MFRVRQGFWVSDCSQLVLWRRSLCHTVLLVHKPLTPARVISGFLGPVTLLLSRGHYSHSFCLGILVCDSFCWSFSESLRGLSWSPCSEAALSTLLQSGAAGLTRWTLGCCLFGLRAVAGTPVCSLAGRPPVSHLSGVGLIKPVRNFPLSLFS